MRVGYLTGENVYLRPLAEEDVDCANAWFDSKFPINASRAKAYFEDEPTYWWNKRAITLPVLRTSNDEIVGSMTMTTRNRRIVTVRFHMAPSTPDADALRAEAVKIVVPWLRDEHEYMVVRLHVADDETETVAAAEALEMKMGVRLREFIARAGKRADELVFEAFNPRWEVQDA